MEYAKLPVEKLLDEIDYLRRRVIELEQTDQTISDSISAMIWHVNQEGTILFVNRAAALTMGFASEDLVGKSMLDLFPPQEASKFIADFQKIALSGTPMLGVTERYTLPSGEIRWTQSDKIPITRKDANIPDIAVFAVDITSHKEAEDSLHSHQVKLSEAMDLARIVYWEADPENDDLTLNDAYYAFYGTTAEREGGYHLTLDEYAKRFVHIDDVPQFLETVERNKANTGNSVPMDGEYRIIRGDGETRHILMRMRFVQNAGGAVCKIIGADLDVTRFRNMEDKLFEMEEIFRLFMEYNPVYVFFKDENLRTLMLSKNYEDLLGKPMKELLGKTMHELFPHEVAERKIKDDLRTLRVGKPIEIQEEFNGRYYSTTKFPIIRGTKPPLLAGFSVDITEWKHSRETMEQNLERLRTLMSAVISVIGMAVEARDPYTAGHQKRVSNIARAIATEMGLPTEQIDGIRLAGSLHDLGKIAIPAEILSLPRKLTDAEMRLVQTHSRTGSDILQGIDFPWPLADIILQHHERLNGSGYPQGLKDGGILLEAKIIAVADVVEAIASHRPYRPALGIDAALEEIEKGRSSLYDPHVVDACLNLFREKGFRIVQEP